MKLVPEGPYAGTETHIDSAMSELRTAAVAELRVELEREPSANEVDTRAIRLLALTAERVQRGGA